MDGRENEWASQIGMRVARVTSFKCDVCGRRRSLSGVTYETPLECDRQKVIVKVCWSCHSSRNRRRWRKLRHLQRLARRATEDDEAEAGRWAEQLKREMGALRFGLDGLVLGGRLVA